MSVTPASFRGHFPEFADATAYPDGTVAFYIGLAGGLLPADRWGDSLDYGTELFTAHHLAIEAKEARSAAAGAIPGTLTGPQASKSVDKVSVSYNTQAVALTDGGFWNLTTYGLRFFQLARMIGAGGYQL